MRETNSLQIYILSRDRPLYLREALRSVIFQTENDSEIIVSDNSESDVVSLMLKEQFPQIRCIRRRPTLNQFEHFRAIIDEASADLLVMFHDDDILSSEYVSVLRKHLDRDPSLVAVCCDAFILRGNKVTKERFLPPGRRDRQIKDPEDLLREYFSLSSKGPAPFPGYMYRRRAIKGLSLDPQEGGKYSDVSFILKILERGSILWVAKPLMRYRIHGQNDSSTENVGHRLQLLRYIYRSGVISRYSPLVAQYRYRYLGNWWQMGSDGTQVWRRRVIRRYLIHRTLIYALTRATLWLRLLNKLMQIFKRSLRSRV